MHSEIFSKHAVGRQPHVKRLTWSTLCIHSPVFLVLFWKAASTEPSICVGSSKHCLTKTLFKSFQPFYIFNSCFSGFSLAKSVQFSALVEIPLVLCCCCTKKPWKPWRCFLVLKLCFFHCVFAVPWILIGIGSMVASHEWVLIYGRNLC